MLFRPQPFAIAVLVLMTLGVSIGNADATILYVKQTGTGACTSWNDACTLQAALAASHDKDEIWVQKGTYKPTTGTEKTIYFTLVPGVAVYGGFAGTESSRDDRNFITNETTLSGDIGTPDYRDDNSYHVVVFNSAASTGVLDGFTIKSGYANNSKVGGGIWISGSPTLSNLTISNNATSDSGGGIYIWDGNPILKNITFSGNTANYGGALYITKGNPALTNVSFSGNGASHGGGGIFIENGNASLLNVTFIENNAYYRGGGIQVRNGSPTLTNVTFSGNSAYQGGGIYVRFEFDTDYLTPTPTLTNVTFSNNTATSLGSSDGSGGGIYADVGTTTIRNSIFWGNVATTSSGQSVPSQIVRGLSATTVISDSVVQNDCPGTCTNVKTAAPLLGTLGNYGGYVKTIPLLAGSSGVDAVTSSCPETDARGTSRPQGALAKCDYGAYEAMPVSTTTTLSSSKSSSTFAEAVTFTATVTAAGYPGTPSGGTVTFKDGETVLGTATLDASGHATFTTSGLICGTHNITAVYGDYSYLTGSTSGAVEQSVILGSTHIAVTTHPPATAVYGSSFGVAATSYSGADASITGSGSCSGSGLNSATITMTSGKETCTILFKMGGDEVTETTQAYKAATATTISSLSSSISLVNQVVTASYAVTAAVAGAGGTVTVSDGTDSCTATLPATTCPLAITTTGFKTITASYSGDDNFAASTSATSPHTVIYPTLYAAAGGLASGVCGNWSEACDLQYALGLVPAGASGIEIWAKGGVYKPTAGTDRTVSFQLKKGVAMYGGFAGTETARSQRDYSLNTTTLSGEIGDLGSTSDNSYHVLTGSGTDSTTILDGFTITSGNGAAQGGGLYIDAGAPTLTNLIFSGNSAAAGGAIFINNGSPILTNVTFSGNSVESGSGGGMRINTGSPTLTNVTFSGNIAGSGGGMSIYNGAPTFTNVTFNENTGSSLYGGGLYITSKSATLANVTFNRNSAELGGGLYITSENAALTNVTFGGNSGTEGGGMYYYLHSFTVPTSITLTDVRYKDNIGSGMEVYVNWSAGEDAFNPNEANMTLRNVTFSGNSGGGLLTKGLTQLILNNGTFSGNSGRGIVDGGSEEVTLTNVTFNGNSVSEGSAGAGILKEGGGNITIHNSIFWGDTAVNAPPGASEIDARSSHCTISDSIIQDGCPTWAECTNVSSVNPLFGTLGSYGGYTETIPLLAGSPALDLVDPASCPATDQRGTPRPQGVSGKCDVGAYEAVPIATTTSLTSSGASTFGGPVTFTATVSAAGYPGTLEGGTIKFKEGETVLGTASLDSAGKATFTTTSVAGGTHTIKAEYPGYSYLTGSTSGEVLQTVSTGSQYITITQNAPATAAVNSTFPVAATALSGLPVAITTSGSCTGAGDGSATVTMTSSTGICTIRYNQPGNTSFSKADEKTETTSPELAGTMTAVSSISPAISFVGQAVRLSYSVTSALGTPTGTVTISDGTQSCTATLPGGSCALAFATAGTKTITASYAGDGAFGASSSAASLHTVLPTRLHVSEDGVSSGVCETWSSPCALQHALGLIPSGATGVEIWARKGVYKATSGADRAATFQLKNGVALYGGFAGDETERGQRNAAANLTTLSGEIGALDDAADNSYHVVTASGTDGTAVLDGFTVTAGEASEGTGGGIYVVSGNPTLSNLSIIGNSARAGNGGGVYIGDGNPVLSRITFSGNSAQSGGGMYINSGSPAVTDVAFRGNSATASSGGGVYIGNADPSLSNVTFSGNSAGRNGGGLAAASGSPTLTNVTFSGNRSMLGGGMYIDQATPTLTNITFSGNSAVKQDLEGGTGGGLYNENGNSTIRNTIFWGNTATEGSPQVRVHDDIISDSIVEGGCPAAATCTNVAAADPLLGPLGNYGGYTDTLPLLAGSPAVDAVAADSSPATDQRGTPRPQGAQGRCDLGAYEAAPAATAIALTSSLSTSAYAQSVTFSAAVSAAGYPGTLADGTVTFNDGETAIGTASLDASGHAALTTSGLFAGHHSITAVYGGYSYLAGSTSSPLAQDVTGAGTTTSVVAGSPSSYGQPVTFTATVTSNTRPPTGAVTFKTGPTILGSATLSNGRATFSTSALAAGSYAITAVYAGDGGFLASTSAEATQVVEKAAATVTLGNLEQRYDGSQKSATVSTTPAGISVTLSYNGSGTPPTAAGSYAVVATVTDGNYAGVARGTLVITQGVYGLTWTTPADISYGTALGDAQLNATAGIAGTFVYSPSAGTILNAGQHALSLTFTPKDTASYAVETRTVTLNVLKATQTINLPPLTNMMMGDPPLSITAAASSGQPVTLSSSNPRVAIVEGNTLTAVGIGTTVITATQAGGDNLEAASISRNLIVAASTTPPAVTLSTLSDGAATATPILNVSGTATSLNGIASLTVNGAAVEIAPGGAFSYPVQLIPGANTITVLATDNAGLTTMATRTVRYTTTGPEFTILSPADNTITVDQITPLTGKVSDTSTQITWRLNGGPPQQTFMSGATFSADITLSPGMNTIEVTAAAPNGEAVSLKRTISIIYDAGFSLTVTDPSVDALTGENSYTIRGFIADNVLPVTVTVSVDGQIFTPTVTDGTFEQKITLTTEKTYTVTITGTDTTGKSVSVQRNIIYAKSGDVISGEGLTIEDALTALMIFLQGRTPTAADLLRFDLAPLDADGKPMGDGAIDVGDVVLILRKIIGLW